MMSACRRPGRDLLDLLRDPAYNESAYARTVADRYRTQHHVEQVDPDDFSLVDRLASLYDEPYADSSAIRPTACASSPENRDRRPLGDGGDENFGGTAATAGT